MDIANFHFLRPFWFIALVPLGGLVWAMARRKLRDQGWKSICDPALFPHILIRQPTRRQSLVLYVLGLAGLLAITALAGPTWERLPEPVFRDQSALVIALDLSRSMDATDVKPSRLIRARFKAADMLKHRKEGLTAFVVYAGDAFTVTPMTDDTATIVSQLPVLSTGLMPAQGSRIDLALAEAGKLLKQSGFTRGDILVITDDVKGSKGVDAVGTLRDQGYRVSIMGVGTPAGAPIPLQKGGFVKDASDSIVISKLNEAPMEALAEIGGGTYTRLRLDEQDIQALQALYAIDRLQNRIMETRLKADIWREQGPWLLLAVIPLAGLAFRRGYLMILALVFLPSPRPALAMDWSTLWLRPDQQASQALDAGDAERAAQLFRDPQWKAAAWYRAGDYEQTLHALQDAEDSESLYNRGNALARLGRYPEAIEAYEAALKRDPGHEDARHNRDLLEDELQQQSQEQQGQPQDESAENQDTQPQNQNGQSQDKQQQDSPSTQEQAQSNDSAQRQDDAQDESSTDVQPPQAAPRSKENQEQTDSGPKQYTKTDTLPEPMDESELATEQWLRRIPDDPGGLLRRKFRYLHQQRSRSADPNPDPW
jgi:Ca-activated chloride channel family protein